MLYTITQYISPIFFLDIVIFVENSYPDTQIFHKYHKLHQLVHTLFINYNIFMKFSYEFLKLPMNDVVSNLIQFCKHCFITV